MKLKQNSNFIEGRAAKKESKKYFLKKPEISPENAQKLLQFQSFSDIISEHFTRGWTLLHVAEDENVFRLGQRMKLPEENNKYLEEIKCQ